VTTETVTVVFPIAGTNARAGFKYRPFLAIGEETFIEAAARPFQRWKHLIDRFVFVCLDAFCYSSGKARRLLRGRVPYRGLVSCSRSGMYVA